MIIFEAAVHRAAADATFAGASVRARRVQPSQTINANCDDIDRVNKFDELAE